MIESQLGEQQKTIWAALILGLGITFAGLHMMVTRPMTAEIARLKTQLNEVNSRMQELTGTTDQAWEASSLLSSLKAQRMQLEDARQSLHALRQLRSEVQEQASLTPAGFAAIDSINELQTRLIEQRPVLEQGEQIVADVERLTDRLAVQQSTLADAAATISQLVDLNALAGSQKIAIARANESLAQMRQITDTLAQQEGVSIAGQALAALVNLKDSISEGAANVEVAQSVATDLIDLEGRLANNSANLEQARQQANGLIGLAGQLSEELQLGQAEQNLLSMIRLDQTLVGQTPKIVDAIQTLELFGEFQNEFISRVQLVGEMRRNLGEFELLESTVAKTVRLLQPLTDLVNLRRMSDEELRQAARSILESRTARLTVNPLPAGSSPSTDSAGAAVPLPE